MGTQTSESGAVVRTFLIADVRGYTSFTNAHGDEAAGVLAARFAALAREAVTAVGGEVVELRGDEALCVFASARQALRAAIELQIRFRERVDGQPVFPLGIGIGLAAGEAVPVEGGYRGGALNLAARLCSLAAAGQILASETVTSLAGTLEGVRFLERRPMRVKGIETPVKAMEVVPDAALPPVPSAPRGRTRRRHPLLAAAGGAIVLGGITAAVIAMTRDGGNAPARLASVAPDTLAAVDPTTNEIVGQVQIPGGPSAVTAGPRFVWVASSASRTVSAIAADTRKMARVIAPGATPSALAADGDAVWTLDGNRRVLLRIDPTYGTVTRRIAIQGTASDIPANRRRGRPSIAFGAGALWVTDGSTRLLRIDPVAGRVVNAVDLRAPLDDVAVAAGSVWAISGEGASVFQVDPVGRDVKTRIRIVNRLGKTAPFPVAVAVGEGSVWVVNANTQTVSRIDPAFGGVTTTIPLGIGRNPSDIAAGAGAVWVANSGNGTLARIDSGTNRVTIIPFGGSPAGVSVAGGQVWVSVQPGFRANVEVSRGAVRPAVARALPASFCSPVEFGGSGSPRFLIASDLPLQGQAIVRETLELSDAIRFVLAEHGFRAGRYSVGYQSCDNSIASTGDSDTTKCRANAQAYASNTNVLGVIGGYNSGCVQAQLAALAGAPSGPLATIGVASTYLGLTRAGPGSAPGEPGKYRPGGQRTFARVVAADDVQGAAAALFAKRIRVRKLFVLHDGDSYGLGVAAIVRDAAKKLGITVAGFERWNPRDRNYARLARQVRQTKADGVFLGGSVLESSNGGAVVKDFRSVLGDRVRILAPDGFSLFAALAQAAGPAAEGVMVSVPFAFPAQLPREGRSFVAEFEKAIGRPVEALSVYAAQATEVLLDAIARSDGSRASVTAELFKTRVTNGLLGSFSFDRNGDTTAGTVTMYRIVGGKPIVSTVITPTPSLVR